MRQIAATVGDLFMQLDTSKRRELDLEDINTRIKEFHVLHDSANIEVRFLVNGPDRIEMRQMLREHKSTLKELTNEYQLRRSEVVKHELFGDHEEKQLGPEIGEGADDMMERGLGIQQSSKESLARTLATIEATKEVGTETVLKLEANTKQVQNMYDELEMIESSLQRSNKIIRRIARKMMTDRYIWVMIVMLVIVVIVVIALAAKKK